jgi:2-polyprenyl-3-methyl-5-hydroxy-6-metoxy-1,4-benzoquinol methylase
MTCLLCESQKSRLFYETVSFGYPLKYVQCMRCGLVYQPTEGNPAADVDFYSEAYREIYEGGDTPTTKDQVIQGQRADNLVPVVERQGIRQIRSMLDIGASIGVLLDAMRERFSCRTVGVEPGDAYREFAAGKGHRMYRSLEVLQAEQPERFQFVSMIHVIEHLPQPVDVLCTIRKTLLAEDGWFLIETPNFYAHDSYELAHLACYTPHTLKEILRQAGYQVLSLHTHGVPRSSRLALYVTALAKPLPEQTRHSSLRREPLVRARREVSMLYRRTVQKLHPTTTWIPLPEAEPLITFD